VKKLLITLLKIGVSVAIVGYLVYDATHGKGRANVFADLCRQSKRWDMLAAAWGFCFVATLLTFIRWWYLVRALGLPCSFSSAIRISFWGYLFNLAPLGIVGGDLVKAVMISREHHEDRAKAVASVVVDRVIGLYWLFVVASAAILLTGFQRIDVPDLRRICMATVLLTGIGTAGLAFVLGPDMTGGRIIRAVGRIPRVGHHLESLINAVRLYNRRPLVLIVSSVMSVGVHCLFACGVYCIAVGLFKPGNYPSLAYHFVIMPLSAAMQVIPVPVGPTECALEFLYRNVPPVVGAAVQDGQGLVVSLAYRIVTILIAASGVYYYFSNRRELSEVIHEAEEEEAAEQA